MLSTALIKQQVLKPTNTMRTLVGPKPAIVVLWPARGEVARNWGDKLNPWIVSKLSGRRVINSSTVFLRAVPTVHAAVGSHIGRIKTPNTKIFGAGFLRQSDQLRVNVQEICAVRGYHTAEKLRDHLDGKSIPVGDAALLMPLLYRPQSKKKYKVGVIPHFREIGLPIFRSLANDNAINVIDITDSIEGFCEQVHSCETVVSSSLHGAILAHAFGIPATIVRVSELPLGDGFKLRDYLSSIGHPESAPRMCTSRAELLDAADSALAPRTMPSMERLLRACPFIDPDIRDRLIARIPAAYPWASWAQ